MADYLTLYQVYLTDMEYICVERHDSGEWWYHPFMGYHKSPLKAISKAKRIFWYAPPKTDKDFENQT